MDILVFLNGESQKQKFKTYFKNLIILCQAEFVLSFAAPELHVDLEYVVFCYDQLKFNYPGNNGQNTHLAHFLSLLLHYSETLYALLRDLPTGSE